MTGPIVDWWRRRRWSRPRLPRQANVAAMSLLPQRLSRRTLYVVGQADRPSWAVFPCPCGTGHTVQVNLDPDRPQPAWTITGGRRGASLQPSIDVHGERRRCHYWLRDGAIQWTSS